MGGITPLRQGGFIIIVNSSVERTTRGPALAPLTPAQTRREVNMQITNVQELIAHLQTVAATSGPLTPVLMSDTEMGLHHASGPSMRRATWCPSCHGEPHLYNGCKNQVDHKNQWVQAVVLF